MKAGFLMTAVPVIAALNCVPIVAGAQGLFGRVQESLKSDAPAGDKSGAGWEYKPSEAVVENVTPAQARATIEKARRVWLDKMPLSAGADRLAGIAVHDDHVEFKTGDPEKPAIRLQIAGFSRIELVRDTVLGSEWFGVRLDEVNVVWAREGDRKDRERAVALADAFYVLKNYPTLIQGREEEFLRAAQWYKEQNPRPQLPEDARRFRVQAELAVRERRYGDAAQRYGEALKIAPWWPEGHFNRALVLAELNRYSEAIRSMKRYLTLVPESPNARQAQDQVYAWEDKAGRAK